uniref:hypothetical protein n=1 Tax=Gelidibacter sp. TaxID=2018083 RepID=UPI00404B144F
MEAIRQFIKVKNRQINIVLPEGFDVDEVEVIILPKENDFELTDEQISILENRLSEPIDDYISSEESLKKLKDKYGF